MTGEQIFGEISTTNTKLSWISGNMATSTKINYISGASALSQTNSYISGAVGMSEYLTPVPLTATNYISFNGSVAAANPGGGAALTYVTWTNATGSFFVITGMLWECDYSEVNLTMYIDNNKVWYCRAQAVDYYHYRHRVKSAVFTRPIVGSVNVSLELQKAGQDNVAGNTYHVQGYYVGKEKYL